MPVFPVGLNRFVAGLPFILVAPLVTIAADTATGRPVVIDASAFWARMPINDRIADATEVEVPWLFNNTALIMRERANVETTVQIPKSGTWYLYSRAVTGPNERNAFRVALGTQVTPYVTGEGALGWKRVGAYELAAGPLLVRLTRINTTPILDTLLLSPDSDFSENDLKPLQLHPDVTLLKEFHLPTPLSLNFGDADNDGRIDVFVMRDNYSSSVVANDGQVLWSYEAPADLEGANGRTTDDINGIIWDLDGDGRSEVLHWRYIEGQEQVVVADGKTGEIRNATPWPMKPLPHAYNNNRIAIAKFGPGRAEHVIVYSDTGGQIVINAYDTELQLVWSHTERKLKDHLGHGLYAVDVDGDGSEEIVLSGIVLDAKGEVVWDRFDIFDDNHDHFDQIRFADLNNDGRLEEVASQSDVGISAYDAVTGRMLWWTQAEHTQRVAIGDFLDGVFGPQIAGSARVYGNRAYEPYLWAQIYWLDTRGNLISKWPENPINANPVFAQGDWRGDGADHLFWQQFHLNRQGRGELYFSEQVYNAFDFQGDRAEEVITLGADGLVRVYGFKDADASDPSFNRDEEYLRRRMVNHDH